jgi:hypothetical protein
MSLVRSFSGIVLGAVVFLVTSCESGPAPPAKGTPAFYWAAAKENFSAGDYVKTSEHLEQLTKSNNEFSARALPWRLVILSGLATGYMDVGDKFEKGMRANNNNSMPFRKQMSDARSAASRLALDFAEAFDRFDKASKDAQIPLAFTSPMGNAAAVAKLDQVANGILPRPPELETAQKEALSRGVLLASCLAAGAANDPAKAGEILKDGTATVPRPTFLRAMAEAYYDQAGVFGKRKLDTLDRRTYFLTHAGDLARQLPDSKENKELAKKIAADLKPR